jgi:outer membrane protein OmpA-like peptidoglycan-associated protein
MKLRVLILISFLLLISHISQAQLTTRSSRAANLYYSGRELYNAGRDQEAIEKLLQAAKVDESFIEAFLMLGEVYAAQKMLTHAIDAFNNAIRINPDFFPNTFFNLAYIHLEIGEYDKARDYFLLFTQRKDVSETLKERARRHLEICDFAIYAIHHPVEFNPVNLGDSINTAYDEYWPSLTADEESLVFTRQVLRDPLGGESLRNKREDFYISQRVDGHWTEAKEVGSPINTDRNEGAQSLSVDGRVMYFTACNREDGYGSCDIYVSVKEGNRWRPPVNLGPPINTGAWEAQPSISPDGRTLYFVSNRSGGYGNMDIWKSVQNVHGIWTEPVNLGEKINTIEDEMSPFIHPDNQTLYFSSKGHIGMGGFDIFKSTKHLDGNWTAPVNLGYPINTHYDEAGLIVTAGGERAFFSSDRLEGAGKDIYMFDLHASVRPISVSYMKGIVYDADTRVRLSAGFELIDLNNSELVMRSQSDNRTGEFLVTIPADRDYALNVSRPDYLFFSENFSLKGITSMDEPFLMDIPLHKIKSGEKVILRNIFFDFDKSDLRQESFVELNKLVLFLKENPTVKIIINGHTDNVGSQEYNMKLSDQRAAAVVRYLTEKGIGRERISSRGYGSSQPVDTNETPEGRAKNRRTEFEVL